MVHPPLFEVHGVSKQYGGVRALSDVTLSVRRGEILGLAGENGAGKSTLFNVMTGILRADSGELVRQGQRVTFHNLRDANESGVFRVYQDQGLVPHLRVYENVLLGQERMFGRMGFLDRRRMIDETAKHLSTVGAESISPIARAGQLKFSDRQLLGIARAVGAAALRGVEQPLILFDEPTAAMAHDELDTFMNLMRSLQRQGATMVFVSHRLREVLDMSDRVYILKDGRVVSETTSSETSEREIHALMVGRPRTDEYYHESRQTAQFGPPVLELDTISGALFQNVSLTVHAGEIVGLGGVSGSGAEAVGRAIAGLVRTDSGRILLHGHDITGVSLSTRIRAGMGYVPLDRHSEGVILSQSVRSNMTLSALYRIRARLGLVLSRRMENRLVGAMVTRLGIRAPGREASVGRLSGGNQQKVVIGRVILTNATFVVLDNPTRGVDAGAKHELYATIRQLAEDGVAILLITEDLPELIGLSNRIAILREGRVQIIVPAPVIAKPTEGELVEHMV